MPVPESATYQKVCLRRLPDTRAIDVQLENRAEIMLLPEARFPVKATGKSQKRCYEQGKEDTQMQPNPRLKREREQRGWSQARVAEQIGTDAINVSRWERGFSSPTPFYREKLCLLFGKTAQELGFLLEETPKQSSSQNLLQLSLEERQQHRAEERSSRDPSPPERLLASLSYALWWLTAVSIVGKYSEKMAGVMMERDNLLS